MVVTARQVGAAARRAGLVVQLVVVMPEVVSLVGEAREVAPAALGGLVAVPWVAHEAREALGVATAAARQYM